MSVDSRRLPRRHRDLTKSKLIDAAALRSLLNHRSPRLLPLNLSVLDPLSCTACRGRNLPKQAHLLRPLQQLNVFQQRIDLSSETPAVSFGEKNRAKDKELA